METLPNELLAHIFGFLEYYASGLRLVCRLWRSLANNLGIYSTPLTNCVLAGDKLWFRAVCGLAEVGEWQCIPLRVSFYDLLWPRYCADHGFKKWSSKLNVRARPATVTDLLSYVVNGRRVDKYLDALYVWPKANTWTSELLDDLFTMADLTASQCAGLLYNIADGNPSLILHTLCSVAKLGYTELRIPDHLIVTAKVHGQLMNTFVVAEQMYSKLRCCVRININKCTDAAVFAMYKQGSVRPAQAKQLIGKYTEEVHEDVLAEMFTELGYIQKTNRGITWALRCGHITPDLDNFDESTFIAIIPFLAGCDKKRLLSILRLISGWDATTAQAHKNYLAAARLLSQSAAN